MKSFLIFCIFNFCLFFSFVYADTPDQPPKKWPCDQVYNPKLNLQSIWQGPSIEEAIKDWWKQDDVIEVVNILSDPILSEEDGIKIIEDFAKKYTYFGLIKKKEQSDKLVYMFAGLYQKAFDKRKRQYAGVIKFVERQESIRKAISEASKKLRQYRKENVDIKSQKYVNADSQLKWNRRVFDQRARLTEYVCEEPVYNTQRLGYQSRKIQTYLK
jgi:hypothetical protein